MAYTYLSVTLNYMIKMYLVLNTTEYRLIKSYKINFYFIILNLLN